MEDKNRIEIINKFNLLNFSIDYVNQECNSGFLPHIHIEEGETLKINEQASLNNILHEISHLNLLPSFLRKKVYGDIEKIIEIEMSKHEYEDLLDIYNEDWYKPIIYCSDQAVMAYTYARLYKLGYPTQYAVERGDEDTLEALSLSHNTVFPYIGCVHLYYAGFLKTKDSFPYLTKEYLD